MRKGLLRRTRNASSSAGVKTMAYKYLVWKEMPLAESNAREYLIARHEAGRKDAKQALNQIRKVTPGVTVDDYHPESAAFIVTSEKDLLITFKAWGLGYIIYPDA